MKNTKMKRIISLLLVAVIVTASVVIPDGKTVDAATTYITVEEFAKALAKEIEIEPVSGAQESGYVNALTDKGIILEGDFTSYMDYLSRTDAAVLLNRADEYLYGDTLDPELVELALEKRISDISKIKASKQTDVVECYLKGFIKGYNNGSYSTDREFRGSKKITKNGALGCLELLKDKSARAKISPDGQLIRTTKLPVYAKYYPYILASYPNDYYDWKFRYEMRTRTEYSEETGKQEPSPYVNIVDYAAPVDIDKTSDLDNFISIKEQYLDTWVEKVRTHMETIFNADYRTIDDEWVETVLSTYYTYGYDTYRESTKKIIEWYVSDMKANKTIVECDKVAVDRSSLYYFDGDYYLRTYVRYRIVSSDVLYKSKAAKNVDKPYGNILHTRYPVVGFADGFELGEWREGHFDVEMSRVDQREIEKFGVVYAILVEQYYSQGRIDR